MSTKKTSHKIFPFTYRDSITLMQLASRISAREHIDQAGAVMATEANIALFLESGMLSGPVDAQPTDLLFVIQGDDENAINDAVKDFEASLSEKSKSDDGDEGIEKIQPTSIEMGVEKMPNANFVVISVPGEFAAAEARKALNLGLNVMMFSDNVALEEEIALKQYAVKRDLIVMGPDCGTAIINSIPLGFANMVRNGRIGVVGASGTGVQQVTSLVHQYGEGISQAIGTGGRDLKEDVGGISMLQGLQALAQDDATKVIVLVSKPPSKNVAEKITEHAQTTGKPVVLNFLGAEVEPVQKGNVYSAETLEEAARYAVALSKGKAPTKRGYGLEKEIQEKIYTETRKLSEKQKYIRGLYSGGTFCYEALIVLSKLVGPVWSNTPVDKRLALRDIWKSSEHTVVDLGDDYFTRGRPHPMIDLGLRNERILQEADDPEVAVILFDLVLGYGSHADPAKEMVPVVLEARRKAIKTDHHPVFVASVCGTDQDPQNLKRQEEALREAGVLLAGSNCEAVHIAAEIINRNKKP
ncbi:MAG: acyl-CoA synthetase FdrA [Gammaproteobacteria bacterium]